MDHTNYTNKLLTAGSNGAVPAAGDNLNDHIGAEENHIQLHHHHNHHQISYDSVWPNFPLQLVHHNYHQVPPSSSSDQIHHQQHHHHDPQLVLAAGNYSNFMDQDQNQLEDQEDEGEEEEEEEELGAMKEMMYRIAAMQPVDIDPATIRKPKRRNVRISEDPQSVAARHRRERISEKIRILQRLVPGGAKMDTASMLDEAIRYVKFLKRQIRLLQQQQSSPHHPHPQCININTASASGGGAIDWPPLPPQQPPIRDNAVITSSSLDIRPAIGFAAFGGG